MNKNTLKLILISGALLVFFVIVFLSFMEGDREEIVLDDREDDYSMILFTGDNCPHCQDVEEFVERENLVDTLDLSIKEVYNNIENRNLLEDKFNQCSPQPRTYGVPLLWNNQLCLIGPSEIINYLNSL